MCLHIDLNQLNILKNVRFEKKTHCTFKIDFFFRNSLNLPKKNHFIYKSNKLIQNARHAIIKALHKKHIEANTTAANDNNYCAKNMPFSSENTNAKPHRQKH